MSKREVKVVEITSDYSYCHDRNNYWRRKVYNMTHRHAQEARDVAERRLERERSGEARRFKLQERVWRLFNELPEARSEFTSYCEVWLCEELNALEAAIDTFLQLPLPGREAELEEWLARGEELLKRALAAPEQIHRPWYEARRQRQHAEQVARLRQEYNEFLYRLKRGYRCDVHGRRLLSWAHGLYYGKALTDDELDDLLARIEYRRQYDANFSTPRTRTLPRGHVWDDPLEYSWDLTVQRLLKRPAHKELTQQHKWGRDADPRRQWRRQARRLAGK